jgi:hypothetical protein
LLAGISGLLARLVLLLLLAAALLTLLLALALLLAALLTLLGLLLAIAIVLVVVAGHASCPFEGVSSPPIQPPARTPVPTVPDFPDMFRWFR